MDNNEDIEKNQSENSEPKAFEEANIVEVDYEATHVVEPDIQTISEYDENMFFNPIQNEDTKGLPVQAINPVKNSKFKGLKTKGFKRAMSYVLVGVICSVIGGASAVGAMMYVVPHTSAFKDSALYKKLADNNTTVTPTKYQPTLVSSNGQGLSVADIAKKVGPAVVGVSTKSQVSYGSRYGSASGVQQGMGSGVIFDAKGYIITNYHVIKGASQIHVILNNNKEVVAKEINHDEANDIAIIQITDKVDLPGIAELGDSSTLQVGELAVAIGNPMGQLLGSVTTGIVSAVDRQIEDSGVKFIQTDAAISPGNSGGPLINSQGQVVGINSEKLVADGSEGLGFAIPINLVKSKVEGLIKTPITTNPNTAQADSTIMIGITIQDIDEALAAENNTVVGVGVTAVAASSPGATAGIKAGDVIVKFDGKAVKTAAELNALKAKHKLGDKVSIVINRNGKQKELTIKFVQVD